MKRRKVDGERVVPAVRSPLGLVAGPLASRSRLVAPHTLREFAERIVKLYESWHAAKPDGGYDEQAAHWRQKLDALSPAPPSEQWDSEWE